MQGAKLFLEVVRTDKRQRTQAAEREFGLDTGGGKRDEMGGGQNRSGPSTVTAVGAAQRMAWS